MSEEIEKMDKTIAECQATIIKLRKVAQALNGTTTRELIGVLTKYESDKKINVPDSFSFPRAVGGLVAAVTYGIQVVQDYQASTVKRRAYANYKYQLNNRTQEEDKS